ncbi:alkanesulfonate monooxygenase SsuD/methylene tetrahydromethanopterin reductase-like flavin-dependent oxidoreductase (luciferase family) [Salana multivorans]|uniref:Alkanesulfonate monooxygenase SsuD/methylene tetrahydromethanopterin reductase-like flavin-dependent oxidoreductase (Luciferase family) n=1 Tax=Salana multivorans TaxID=120377 RepID=A0A3N2D7R4_9MICO|nr:LLM class flavin-dependent oxidoreductase [Salana multivorans]ROR95820.1 alkanesulfonate monooxygenase SsuD/methylene tetrahydromethanopterin reductase-like flavin-dependent oxidoreductase (luciferase family) [Salana multivorans]
MSTPANPGARRRVTIALQSDKAVATYAHLATQAERSGFDGLSVYADLGFQPPLAALVTAAGATSRMTLGPACLNPYLTHPVEIAGQAAVLDEASGGRSYLGLVRGSWLDRVGVDQPRPLAAIEDTVEIVRRLLAGDTSGYAGRVFTLEPGMALHYTPLRSSIPVLIGTWGPRGAQLAGRVADEVKIGGSTNPDMVRLMRTWLDEAALAAGRPRDAVALAAGAVTVVARDGAAARAHAREQVAMYVDVVGALDPTVHIDPELLAGLRERLEAGDVAGAGALVPDDVLDRFAFAGTPEEVAAHAVELFEAGADRVEFGTPHGLTESEGFDLLGGAVLPAIREAVG